MYPGMGQQMILDLLSRNLVAAPVNLILDASLDEQVHPEGAIAGKVHHLPRPEGLDLGAREQPLERLRFDFGQQVRSPQQPENLLLLRGRHGPR